MIGIFINFYNALFKVANLFMFISRAYLLEQDSKAQVTALHLIIGTLQRMHVFGVENRDTLTHKATGVNPMTLFSYN